jgi:hypothetical protein
MKQLDIIPNPHCKVTLYWWNNKYILKFETPFFEQTYKVSEMDIANEDEVRQLATNEDFLAKVYERFRQMKNDSDEALDLF